MARGSDLHQSQVGRPTLDTKRLLAALREETLPKLPEARSALEQGQAGIGVVRELLHKVAGTAAVAGLPSVSRLARAGELVALAALEGEATVGPRLKTALGQVMDAIEAELGDGDATVRMPAVQRAEPKESRGQVAVLSDENVSAKLLVRFLEEAGFEPRRYTLEEAAGASPEGDVLLLDLPAAESPHTDAILAAASSRRVPLLVTAKGDPAVEPLKRVVDKAATFLGKPVVPESLETAVRTLVARRRAVVAARSRAPTAQVLSPVARAKPLRVLVVDDSRVIRSVVREALSEVGLVTVEAESGGQALEAFEAEPTDAVISDLQMPGLDGAELTKLLRERSQGRRVPIIVLSALDDEASRQAGLAAGADAWLVKSVIDGPALLQALRAAGLAI